MKKKSQIKAQAAANGVWNEEWNGKILRGRKLDIVEVQSDFEKQQVNSCWISFFLSFFFLFFHYYFDLTVHSTVFSSCACFGKCIRLLVFVTRIEVTWLASMGARNRKRVVRSCHTSLYRQVRNEWRHLFPFCISMNCQLKLPSVPGILWTLKKVTFPCVAETCLFPIQLF